MVSPMKKLVLGSVIAVIVMLGANNDKGTELADAASHPDILSTYSYSFEV